MSAKWHALKIALVSWFSLFFENASPNCFHGFTIVAFALLFSWVPVIGRDSPILNIFSWTIITMFVIDTKSVLTCGTVTWKPQNAPWRDTGDVNWNAVATLMLDNCGYQTDRKIYYQSQIAPCLRSSRSRQNYKFASARCLEPRFARNKLMVWRKLAIFMGNLQTPKPKFHCDTVSEDLTPLGVTINNKVKTTLIAIVTRTISQRLAVMKRLRNILSF